MELLNPQKLLHISDSHRTFRHSGSFETKARSQGWNQSYHAIFMEDSNNIGTKAKDRGRCYLNALSVQILLIHSNLQRLLCHRFQCRKVSFYGRLPFQAVTLFLLAHMPRCPSCQVKEGVLSIKQGNFALTLLHFFPTATIVSVLAAWAT